MILMKNEQTGQIRECPEGFSWTMLFFGFFVPMMRQDYGWAWVCFFMSLLTLGLYSIITAFFYNGSYIKRLELDGYKRMEMG